MASKTARRGFQGYVYPNEPPAHLDTSQNPETQAPGTFPHLVGIDGRYTGRLKRFPGFLELATLPLVSGGSDTLGSWKGLARNVFEYFAVQEDIKSDGVLRGFVYLAYDDATDVDFLSAYYYRTSTSAWESKDLIALTADDWYVTELDVTYDSRHIYAVGALGKDADTCTFDNTTETVTATGHGLSVGDAVYFTNSGGALPAELTEDQTYFVLTVPTADTFTLSDTRGGSTFAFADDGTGTHSLNYHPRKLQKQIRYATVEPVGDFTGVMVPVATPEWRSYQIEPGTRYELHTGSTIVSSAADVLSTGEYVFAYRFYSSDQRWYGPVSEFFADTAGPDDYFRGFAWDGPATNPTLITGLAESTMRLPDDATSPFFTSMKVQLLRSTAGNTSVSGSTPGTLYVEKELDAFYDNQTAGEEGWYVDPDEVSTGPTPNEAYVYWGKANTEGLTDAALVLQTDLDPEEVIVYHTAADKLGEPPAKLCQEYEDLLFRVSIPMQDDEAVDLDVARWSSTNFERHNLLPILNRRLPKGFSSDMKELLLAEPYLLLVETNRIVRFHRSGARLSTETIHNTHGVSGKDGCIAVGTHAFLMSPPGLLLVDLTAQTLEVVQAAQRIILTDWKDSLDDVQTCYDSQLGAIFFLNPTEEEALVVWMSTGVMSTLEDMNFAEVAWGPHPEDGGSNIAFFMTSSAIATELGRVYTVDVGNQAAGPVMRGTTSTTRPWNVPVVAKDATTIRISSTLYPLLGISSNDLPFYLYVLSGEDKGSRYKCTSYATAGGQHILTVTPGPSSDLAVGDYVSLAPVPFKVTHWPLSGLPDEYMHDPYHTRTVHTTLASIGALDTMVDEVPTPDVNIPRELRCSLYDKNLSEVSDSVGYLTMSETPGQQVYTPGNSRATYLPHLEQYTSAMNFELTGILVSRTIEPGLSGLSSI